MITITVNGKPHTVPDPSTLSGMLKQLGIDPTRVAIEHNGVILMQENFTATGLHEGDRLEIIQFVGGG